MFVTACPLVLASASPRRRELLHALGLRFTCKAAEIDERPLPDEAPTNFALRMARAKALAVAATEPPAACVIAADTVVVVGEATESGGRILGKPRDHAEALDFLRLLNGRAHTVVTGLALLAPRRGLDLTCPVQSRVRFGRFEENVLAAYAAGPEPLDKAGAYAVQGAGAFLVETISGSATNVIGLPMTELVDILSQHQLIAPVADMGRVAGQGAAGPASLA